MRFLILIILLSSCSANWHLNKAVKKGAELEQISVPVYLYDTIVDTVENKIFIRTRIKDTIYETKTLVKYVPKTKWKTRIEYKTNRDSLRHVEKLYRDSIRVEKKKLSVEKNKNNRLNRFMWWLMVFFVLILIVYIALRIVASKLLK
jgi:hypothetical protein